MHAIHAYGACNEHATFLIGINFAGLFALIALLSIPLPQFALGAEAAYIHRVADAFRALPMGAGTIGFLGAVLADTNSKNRALRMQHGARLAHARQLEATIEQYGWGRSRRRRPTAGYRRNCRAGRHPRRRPGTG